MSHPSPSLPRCAPRMEAVRADALRAGDRVMHQGQIVRILRIRNRARIEALVQGVGSPDTGDHLKLRHATRLERIAA